MPSEQELSLARQKVFQAEEALYIQLHSREYDNEHCRRLAEQVMVARENLLDQLAKFWREN